MSLRRETITRGEHGICQGGELRPLHAVGIGGHEQRIYYPIIPPWFIQSRFDALSKIRKVPYPKLIFHSVNDEIVPFRLGQALFKAAEEPKTFVELRGGHNEAFWDSKDAWLNGIKSFLAGL